MPAVIAPSPITAIVFLFGFPTAIPSAALIDVLEWPTPNASYSLSDLLGKGARPSFFLIVSISFFLPVIIL